jgi:hypothetical protein
MSTIETVGRRRGETVPEAVQSFVMIYASVERQERNERSAMKATAMPAGAAPRVDEATLWRVIVASSLGTLFEWYDFYLYDEGGGQSHGHDRDQEGDRDPPSPRRNGRARASATRRSTRACSIRWRCAS